VLKELFEVYRGYFLEALDFGQNAVNTCVEPFDVVTHDGLAHAGWQRTVCRLAKSFSASARVSGTLIIERRPCKDSHTPSSYWSALMRTSASVLNDVSISFVMMVLSEARVALFDVTFDH